MPKLLISGVQIPLPHNISAVGILLAQNKIRAYQALFRKYTELTEQYGNPNLTESERQDLYSQILANIDESGKLWCTFGQRIKKALTTANELH